MNCSEVQELLSAYYDGEVASELASEIAEHLHECDHCQRELDGFRRLSQMAHGLEVPTAPADTWGKVRKNLNDDVELPRFTRRAWLLRGTSGIGIAAAVLVAIGLCWFGFRPLHRDDHEKEFTSVFGEYLKTFQASTVAAQQFLFSKYEAKSVNADDAAQVAGFRPIAPNNLPPQYKLDSMYVWKMPCCTCVQCLCTREDGSTVAIFEHDEAQPHWFGDRPSIAAICGGQNCNLVEVDGHLAATWKHGPRHITVIGLRDVGEAESLVSALGESIPHDGQG